MLPVAGVFFRRYLWPGINEQKKMIIRKATIEDSEAIATHLLLAMEEIVYEFIGVRDYTKAREFMVHFARNKDNQYSHDNCWVAEEEGEVIAAVNVYDGTNLNELRSPIIEYVKVHFGKSISPEDETQPGEFYVDSLGVNPNQRGRGVGSRMLEFLIDEYVSKGQKILGLLVDEENPNAKKLYLKLGFLPVGKKTLVGKKMEHLQVKAPYSD